MIFIVSGCLCVFFFYFLLLVLFYSQLNIVRLKFPKSSVLLCVRIWPLCSVSVLWNDDVLISLLYFDLHCVMNIFSNCACCVCFFSLNDKPLISCKKKLYFFLTLFLLQLKFQWFYRKCSNIWQYFNQSLIENQCWFSYFHYSVITTF